MARQRFSKAQKALIEALYHAYPDEIMLSNFMRRDAARVGTASSLERRGVCDVEGDYHEGWYATMDPEYYCDMARERGDM